MSSFVAIVVAGVSVDYAYLHGGMDSTFLAVAMAVLFGAILVLGCADSFGDDDARSRAERAGSFAGWVLLLAPAFALAIYFLVLRPHGEAQDAGIVLSVTHSPGYSGRVGSMVRGGAQYWSPSVSRAEGYDIRVRLENERKDAVFRMTQMYDLPSEGQHVALITERHGYLPYINGPYIVNLTIANPADRRPNTPDNP